MHYPTCYLLFLNPSLIPHFMSRIPTLRLCYVEEIIFISMLLICIMQTREWRQETPIIHVLRLGHRPIRDKRITTHVCLTARAFGAEKIIITGTKDTGLIERVKSVVRRWGGAFEISYNRSWKSVVSHYKKEGWYIVHLTMYGCAFKKGIDKILMMLKETDGKARKRFGILVIVGSEKVPPDAYRISDLNISVTYQPHSEVAALAVFLDHLMMHSMYEKMFNRSNMHNILRSVRFSRERRL